MDRLLTLQETAEALRISPHTLRNWIWTDRELGPMCVHVGRLVRFRERDIADYLDQDDDERCSDEEVQEKIEECENSPNYEEYNGEMAEHFDEDILPDF